jgi:nitrite reductase/ring-hydroxylating ferredoxin subunit
MPRWLRAADESALGKSPGSALRVELGGEELALFRLADGVYCLDDVCSHEYSRLSEGEVWDEAVYCPKHGSRFDIRTGAVTGLPATRDVRTAAAKVEDGAIYVDLGSLA